MLNIYIAGPDVFRKDAIARGQYMKDFCKYHGFNGMYPFDNDGDNPTAANIYKSNVEILRKANCIVANMQPFHGPSMDVGTVWECGFATALGIPVIGYTNDKRILKERIVDFNGPLVDGKYTNDGMMFDDFDEIENLMIAKSVEYIADSFEDAILYAKEKFSFKNMIANIWNPERDSGNFEIPPYGDFEGC